MERAVSITFTTSMAGVTEAELRLLLRDALGEFHIRRTPAYKYVSKRYKQQSPDFQDRKREEVDHRCKLAKSIEVMVKGESALVALARCAEETD